MDGLDPETRHVKLENPQFTGDDEGRVYLVHFVEYACSDHGPVELKRITQDFKHSRDDYYPTMGSLWDKVAAPINRGLRLAKGCDCPGSVNE